VALVNGSAGTGAGAGAGAGAGGLTIVIEKMAWYVVLVRRWRGAWC
jgi:hypothetical protein